MGAETLGGGGGRVVTPGPGARQYAPDGCPICVARAVLEAELAQARISPTPGETLWATQPAAEHALIRLAQACGT